MTTWGIGTGRCGTATLAIVNKGLHEPRPWFYEEATRYYWGERDEELMETLRRKVAQRIRSPYEMVVDQKQSLIIPLLVEMDPEAKFVWLIREPIDAVKSYMAFGYFRRETGKWDWQRVILDIWRLRPQEGWPNGWSAESKCFWYWYEVNRVIERDLKETGAEFEIIFTHDLGEKKYNCIEDVLNIQKGIGLQHFKPRPKEVFDDPHTVEFYEKWVEPFGSLYVRCSGIS
jgi:hypothetical protein